MITSTLATAFALCMVYTEPAVGNAVSEKQLFGTWRSTVDAVNLTVGVRRDHRISWTATYADMPDVPPINGTWRLEGNRLFIVWEPDKTSVTAVVQLLTDDTLVLRMPDGPVTFRRAEARKQPTSSNQSMKPTSPQRNKFSVFAATPCRGLSPSR